VWKVFIFQGDWLAAQMSDGLDTAGVWAPETPGEQMEYQIGDSSSL
jgi:hypothetical protein